MDFSKYTTQVLVFITSNFESFKKELEKRNVRKSAGFPFKTGDVVHSKYNNDNFLIKIKEICYGDIIADEIVIRDDGTFNAYVDEFYDINNTDINNTEWYEFVKIEDSKIFENLLNIIDKYSDDAQQLNDDTYLKLKNEIAPYDN